MLSSSLKTKTLRATALCAAVLFSPFVSAWDKPSATNQALISAAVLLASPVLDGILHKESDQSLGDAIKAQFSQKMWGEGIESRKENEGFLAHKWRVFSTYSTQNLIFSTALALVVLNALDSCKTEYDRLVANQNPDAAKLAQAVKDLTEAQAKLKQTEADLQKANEAHSGCGAVAREKATLESQLKTAQEEKDAATRELEALTTEHAACGEREVALLEQIGKLKTLVTAVDRSNLATIPEDFNTQAMDAFRAVSALRRNTKK